MRYFTRLIFLPFVVFAQAAEELRIGNLSPGQIELNKAYEIYLKVGAWPDMPSFQLAATNEREALIELKDKSKKYNPDRLSHAFVQTARATFLQCGIDQKIKSAYPSKFKYFNKNFYAFLILSVPFNLCVDDSASCDFESSYVAKNFPQLGLILVNAYRWNSIPVNERMGIAVHEFLGLLQIEEGTYGISSKINFQSVRYTSGNMSVTQKVCLPESIN